MSDDKPKLPFCPICFEHTLYPVAFRCTFSQTLHTYCAPCAVQLVQHAYSERNFCGSVTTIGFITHKTVRCSLCKGTPPCVSECPVAMYPMEIYALLPTKPADLCCAKCKLALPTLADTVKHMLYECSHNTFECDLCKQPVEMTNLRTESMIEKHVMANQCTGIKCSYLERSRESGEIVECTFTGTYSAVMEHYKLHPFMEYLRDKFADLIASSDRAMLVKLNACFLRATTGGDQSLIEPTPGELEEAESRMSSSRSELGLKNAIEDQNPDINELGDAEMADEDSSDDEDD